MNEQNEREKRYTQINAETFDKWVAGGWEWGKPVSSEVIQKARNGEWGVLLTPTKVVPQAWFGDLKGKKLLGLASGGGQQMPVFAVLGAQCTVLDYSQAQLESERSVAAREGYEIEIIRADMTKPLPFADESFDLIFHPVSNCYVKDVEPIWRECFRVLKKGGALLSGLDNGINFAFGEAGKELTYHLPFDPLADEQLYAESVKNDWGIQFSHTIEEQIGGQLRAGFVLMDVYGDTDGSGPLHDYNVTAYWATRAVKP